MEKYLYGLGAVVAFKTECEEIEKFLNTFYFLTDEKPKEEIKIIDYFIEKYGKDYLVTCQNDIVPVSWKKIQQYINYSVIQKLTEAEQDNSVYLHSSAFTYGDKLFILFNSSGAGKTTLTAYCLKKNRDKLKYLGDDVTRIDLKDGKVYGLSSGQRIKSGSKDLFFGDEHLESFVEGDETIWIYKPKNEIALSSDINDYKNVYLLNIKYNSECGMQIKRIDGLNKIQAIISNIYNIQDNSSKISKNLSAFSKFNMYSIEYSETEAVMNNILSGFKND